jgi:hypothetical protein
MRWEGHVTRMEKSTCVGCWYDSQREGDHKEDQDAGEWILER